MNPLKLIDNWVSPLMQQIYHVRWLGTELATTLKKKFRTHVIKLDIAPKSYPPGQYLLVSASNNMLYYLSQ